MSELPDYINTLLRCRDEYRNDIELLIGFEVEYTRKYFDKLMKILRQYPVDYIIQGQHNVPDEPDGFYAGNRTGDEERLKDYVDYTIEGMRTGLFSYLAHPDLINFTGDDVIYKKHMRRIVEASIELNMPLEVNMYGFLGKRNYPCDSFFSMASEMGASFIIGCDAHYPKDVRQPENLEGLTDFLERNGITWGDNILELRSIL
jgi:histidinol-phosphatase (PHP family)